MMLHQPSGGSRGVAADIEIQAQEILLMRERLNKLIAEHTGQDEATVAKDTDRDFWMSPDAALEFLEKHEAIWTKWVSADVAAKVKKSL